jgi:hypothetical protein
MDRNHRRTFRVRINRPVVNIMMQLLRRIERSTSRYVRATYMDVVNSKLDGLRSVSNASCRRDITDRTPFDPACGRACP